MARPDSPEVIYLDSNTLCRFIVGDHVEGVVAGAFDAVLEESDRLSRLVVVRAAP